MRLSPFARRSRFFLLPVTAGFIWFPAAALGQQSRAPRGFTTAHVYVQVDRADGEGLGFLSKRHFSLSAAGQPLPFALTNVTISRKAGASVPRNYLLVLLPPLLPEEMKEPCRAFASTLKAHWRIRIVDPSGALPETIACGTGTTRSVIRTIRAPEMDAVKELENAHGRHVVLYLTSGSHVLDQALQKIANDAGAMVYDVGGREENFVYEPDHDPSQTAPGGMSVGRAPLHVVSAGATDLGAAFVVEPGVPRPERSIRSALRDATNGARGFYVLTTRLRESTPVLSLGVKVQGGLQVAAQLAVDEGDAPRLQIVQ